MSTAMQEAAEKFFAATPTPYAFEDYRAKLDRMGRLTPLVLEMTERAEEHRRNHLLFYIAGPLTGMPEEVKSRYVAVSDLIASYQKPVRMFGYAPHLHGTDPVVHPDVTPQEVRDIDYLFARVIPHGHVNFLNPVGHGNAIEEGWAEEAGIPSLYVEEQGVHLSRLVRGMDNIAGTVTYTDFENDGLPQIDEYLDAIKTGYAARAGMGAVGPQMYEAAPPLF